MVFGPYAGKRRMIAKHISEYGPTVCKKLYDYGYRVMYVDEDGALLKYGTKTHSPRCHGVHQTSRKLITVKTTERETIIHEIGHAIDGFLGTKNRLTYDQDKLVKKVIKADDYCLITDYANTSFVEWFAESMTAYMNGGKKKEYKRETLKKVAPNTARFMRKCLQTVRAV